MVSIVKTYLAINEESIYGQAVLPTKIKPNRADTKNHPSPRGIGWFGVGLDRLHDLWWAEKRCSPYQALSFSMR